MKNRFTTIAIAAATVACALAACHKETLQEKAEREAREYTRRYCPTPVIDYTSIDSLTFDRTKNLYTYYFSFHDVLDNEEIIDSNKDKIAEMLHKSISESTSMKNYVEADFHFRYVCHSAKDKRKVLFQTQF